MINISILSPSSLSCSNSYARKDISTMVLVLFLLIYIMYKSSGPLISAVRYLAKYVAENLSRHADVTSQYSVSMSYPTMQCKADIMRRQVRCASPA